MTVNVDNTDRIVGLILALIALSGAVLGWVRWLRPRWRTFWREVRAVRDSILGREPMKDSVTGIEIPHTALPGIGVRMAHQEKQMELLTEAVAQIANSHLRFDNLETHVANHEERLKSLEDASVERVVTKVESTQAWRTIEKAIQADPDETPDLD